MARQTGKRITTALAVGVAALVLAPAAGATVYVVNTTQDLPSDAACTTGPNGCTIRDALAQATSADSITLPGGIYNINPQLGPLSLTGDKLNGAGARSTIIDGGLAVRVMQTSSDATVNPQVTGVTIRRGRATGSLNTDIGGGIQVAFGTLTLVDSQVLNSTADTSGGGIGLGSGENLVLVRSTVAGNTSIGGNGGAIYSANEGIVAVANSTISGNVASAGESGGIFAGGGSSVQLLNTTVASNSGATGGGLSAGFTTVLRNTILASNSPAQCVLVNATVTSNNNLVSDGTCGLSGTGDIQGVNPGLGALANNGGPTDTRAIGPSSLAVNHGGAQCQTTDQRTVTRPQLGVCDIGAYEYRAPRLTVVKRVVNDQGGTLKEGNFNVHVRAGAADVAGSPSPGSPAGRTYTLTPGSYTVSEDADSRYAASFSGACNASGAVTLAEGQVATCTITNNDKPPVANKFVNALPKSGTVKIKLPGRRRFRQLKEGEQIPVGTIVDVLKGRVTLFAAANKNGGTAKADFYGGIFKLTQTKGSKPITVLTLVEALTGCNSKGKATAAAKKKRKRRLWGDGSGRFRTKGKHSAATVVGTKWLVEDSCDSTLTRVKRGKVSVRDFIKKKTVIVKAGHRYIARRRG